MPSVTLDVPAGQATRVFDAIAAEEGYNPATDGTKAAFCKVAIIRLVMARVRRYERNLAAKAAGDTAEAAAESQIIIT